MNVAARIAVFALPVIGLGALWGLSDYESRKGTQWDVAIEGYDPRDLLRGHYVEFTYDWDVHGDAAELQDEFGFREQVDRFCLTGSPPGPPVIDEINGDISACDYPVEADWSGVYGDEGLMRGRLYVGQDRAREIEQAMFDQDMRAIVRVRLGDNRRLTPLDISFRPLTAEEQAERDARLADLPDVELPAE